MPIARCNHCNKDRAWQTKQMDIHLLNCKLFKQFKLKQPDLSVLSKKPVYQPAIFQHAFIKFSNNHKAYIKHLLARACFIQNLPFDVYEQRKDEAPNAILKALRAIHPDAPIPSPKAIANEHLLHEYNVVKEQVMAKIEATRYLNLVSDETTNIRREQVQNLCVNTPEYGAFYVVSEQVKDVTLSHDKVADWVIKHTLNDLLDGNEEKLERVNSIAFDNATTMQAAARLVKTYPGWKHVFLIGCDSHGLQLFIKDIVMEVKFIEEVFKTAQLLARAFANAHKMLKILRGWMLKIFGKVHSLVLSVITRWGTQLAMLKAIQRLKPAILEFFAHPPPGMGAELNALSYLPQDAQFWLNLELIISIFEPIDQAIKASESERSHIGKVVGRWAKMFEIIEEKIARPKQLHPSLNQVPQLFKERFLKQTKDVYIAAHLFNPLTKPRSSIPFISEYEWRCKLHAFFVAYGVDYQEAMKEFNEFRNRSGRFTQDQPMWEYKDYTQFWEMAMHTAPNIGKLAVRMGCTPANSVPSERAFSILKLIHTRLRSQLNSTRIDMLQYIYINYRVLERVQKGEDVEEALVEIEDQIYRIQDAEDAAKSAQIEIDMLLN